MRITENIDILAKIAYNRVRNLIPIPKKQTWRELL
jgi:hypothetical protein